MSNATQALVSLGRFMITHAPRFVDDRISNDWARVGQLLTGLGMPFAPKLREFSAQDQSVVRSAAAVMTRKAELPAVMEVQAPVQLKRTRKARMTRVMTKAPRATAAKTKPQSTRKRVSATKSAGKTTARKIKTVKRRAK